MSKLLKNILLLDSETTGLDRGSGIFEASVFNPGTGSLVERYLDPNVVVGHYDPSQETTRLASNFADVHRFLESPSWEHTLRTQYTIKDLSTLEQVNSFLSRGLKQEKYRLLTGVGGEYINRRVRELSRIPGVDSSKVDVGTGTSEQVFGRGGMLHQAMESIREQGGTIWGANTAFESKMIGAQLGALDQRLLDAGQKPVHALAIKAMLETRSESSDPFYVTGVGVNTARTKSQISGDWTGTWKAYNTYTPKPGTIAVRDIQDVLRAQTSYAHKLGLTKIQDAYTGTSMDLVSRLFSSLDPNMEKARAGLGTAEVHKAAEDVAKTEIEVLRKTIHYTQAMQEAYERTDLGMSYLNQLERGTGPLADMSTHYRRMEELLPELQTSNLVARLGRAQVDMWEKGGTYQQVGYKTKKMRQQSPEGEVIVPGLRWERERIPDWDALTAHLELEQQKKGKYSDINIGQQVQAFRTHMGDSRDLGHMNEYIEQHDARHIYEGLGARDELLDIGPRPASTVNKVAHEAAGFFDVVFGPGSAASTKKSLGGAAQAMKHMSPRGIASGFVAGAGVLASMGVGASILGVGGVEKQNRSVVSFGYEEWLAQQQYQQQQAAFTGSRDVTKHMEGMGHDGIAGATRSKNTDFGSPYMGILGSQSVFHDQELLKEREKFLRTQYADVHFDSQSGLFGIAGVFKNALPRGYSYIPAGESVGSGEFQSLKGNLKKINLRDGNWKVDIDDADTIVVKRGGIRGAVGSFFGMNRGYGFRIAGIDAPETYHGGQSYHAPQPGAGAATNVFKRLVHGAEDLTLVFDPKNTTYGRAMGTLIADNKNLSFELVKRGAVTHLPFDKAYKSMIDYDALGKVEAAAHAAGRGIWSQPYYKAFYDITKAKGQRYTLNTLSRKERIAENVSTMDAISLMEQSQAQGLYTSAHAAEAQSIGYAARSRGPDHVKPFFLDRKHSHYNSYIGEMTKDLSKWNTTNGGGKQNRFRSKGGYGKLDKAMVLDTLGSTTNIHNRRRFAAFDHYKKDQKRVLARRMMQSQAQRNANHDMFRSPTNHHETQ